jgi:hypothetical protein
VVVEQVVVEQVVVEQVVVEQVVVEQVVVATSGTMAPSRASRRCSGSRWTLPEHRLMS